MNQKMENLLQHARRNAAESPMNFQHGAIIFNGKKIVSGGCNHYFSNYHGICCHAEMDALKHMCHLKKMKWSPSMKSSSKKSQSPSMKSSKKKSREIQGKDRQSKGL